MTPIANLNSPNSEWMLDTSWTTPPLEPNTLAAFIHDLTVESDIPPIQEIELRQLDLNDPADLNLTLANLFEADPEVEQSSEPEIAPDLEVEPEIDPVVEIISESEINLLINHWINSEVELEPDAPAIESKIDQTEQTEQRDLDRLHTPISIPPEGSSTAASAELELDTAMLDQLDQLLAPSAADSPAADTSVIDSSAANLTAAEPLAEPPDANPPEAETQPGSWFLGIDIGTTGISAVLLNQRQCQLYPLYWQPIDAETPFAAKKQFRLSTTVTLATADSTASALPTIRLEPAPAQSPRLRLSDWKPYLKVAVPHHSPQTAQWEPVLQWADTQIPLRMLQEALQQLLATLHPNRSSFIPSLTCAALGLETDLPAILHNLAGIVVGYPSNWSDTYSFNLRESILQAELVARPDQIVFIEEAIATLLSALPAADGRSINLSHQQGQSGHLHNADWRGVTLILTAGASLTELVLVNLPQSLQQLNPTDFYVRSLPYAGAGLDQDVLSQLLYPALLNLDPNAASPELTSSDFELSFDLNDDLNELELANLLPQAAELDLSKRYLLQQHLLSSSAGQQLLTAARSLKITLQHQPRFTVQYGSQQFTIERQDLTSRVLLPYVQRLNRELNALLAQTNTTAAAVSQVICTGGTASLGAITRWLRQKLPSAMIIQDTYPRPASPQDNGIPSCSRVAYGLATVPLHPQVIDQARHQYSDYFLLLELLRTLPSQPVRIDTIMQLLEQRGIDTQACRFRILALLDGHLPPGLVPADADLALLTPESAANPDYQAIQFAPVFAKQADRTYQLNRPQWDYLQQYLETLLADTEQTLDRPLEMLLGTESDLEA